MSPSSKAVRRAGILVRTPGRLARALAADRCARRAKGPGLEFGNFGRRLGLRALARGNKGGLELLVTPVSSTRYWEFPFTARHLPDPPGRCLDVSSPRLFALWVASRHPRATIRMLNPDTRDAHETRRLAASLGLEERIEVAPMPVSALEGSTDRYDTAWSISVIEHIPDEEGAEDNVGGDVAGDSHAMRLMWEALAPGGRLIVTVPSDTRSWDEYRPTDTYGLGLPLTPQGYFFQRWYDEARVRDRLLDPLVPLGLDPESVTIEWWGEREAGHLAAYIAEWMAQGADRTLTDPCEFAENYRPYAAWSEMPGQGVCGIAITKGD